MIRGTGIEESLLESGICAIGYSVNQSIIEFTDIDDLRAHIRNQPRFETANERQVTTAASQLWRFATEIEVDDMVVMPRRQLRVIAIGRITGQYAYDDRMPRPHTRKVEWQVRDIPRDNFDTDLLNSFGGLTTVYQPRASNSEARIESVMNVYLGHEQAADSHPPDSDSDDLIDDTARVNLEESINDRIIERIREKFKEHRLEYLVARILEAEGYTVLETRPGPDGGVDIVAGSGELGFGQPRLCVQVKSGQSPVGVGDYRGLQGSVQTFGADHGLLVSLTGFTQPVHNANRQSFFMIRLWGPEELVENLLDTYDDLPLDIRSEIPLQSRRVLVESDE